MDAEFGIAFQTDKPPGAYGPLAAAAEAHGFDVVSAFADLLYQPPLPALLEIARATSRVRLGAACFNPYTPHPYEIAGPGPRRLAGRDRHHAVPAAATAARGRRCGPCPAGRRRDRVRRAGVQAGARHPAARRAAGPRPAAAARRVGATRNRPRRTDRR